MNVPFRLPWLALAAPEYWYCAPNLMSWSPCLPGRNQASVSSSLDAVVDARLRRVVLLIGEVWNSERRLALRQVAAVAC